MAAMYTDNLGKDAGCRAGAVGRHPQRIGEPGPSAVVVETEVVKQGDACMGRGLILWLVGIPLPVILLLYALGYLH
jgi:hypothetical protein